MQKCAHNIGPPGTRSLPPSDLKTCQVVTWKVPPKDLKTCRLVREILIFEGAIFLIWNHPFYCLFRQSVFKTVFFLKIGPIIGVRVKIWPPPPPIIMTNGKIAKKVDFDSSKKVLDALNATQEAPALYKVRFLKKSRKSCKKYHLLTKLPKMVIFGGFSWFFQKPHFVESWGFLCCVQCIKTLLLSYHNQLFWQFYRLSL